MHLHNPFYQRKTDAGALHFHIHFAEQLENPVMVLRGNTNPIIPDQEDTFTIYHFKTDSYDGIGLVAHKLDGVRDQILEDLHQPHAVDMHKRQIRLSLDLNLPCPKNPCGGFERILDDFLKLDILRRVDDTTYPGKLEQFVHKGAHLFGGFIDLGQVLFGAGMVA